MQKPLMFVLRAAFLVFFWLNAWNMLNKLDESGPRFKDNFGRFEKSLKEVAGVDMPVQLSVETWGHLSEDIVKVLASIQLGLVGMSLLVWYRLTVLVGFMELVLTCIRLNVLKFDMQTRLTDWEPLALSIAMFGASIVLSQKYGEKRRKRRRRRKSVEREDETEDMPNSSAN